MYYGIVITALKLDDLYTFKFYDATPYQKSIPRIIEEFVSRSTLIQEILVKKHDTEQEAIEWCKDMISFIELEERMQKGVES